MREREYTIMRKITIIKRKSKKVTKKAKDQVTKASLKQTQSHATQLAGEDAQTVMRSGCKNNEDK